MKAHELRQKYFEFFKSKQHKLIPSASLIPENDPTVLFTTAGMHPLVPYLLGQPHPLGKKLVDIQKCIRTGDIEEIGDATHHTFFEMLGNWSLGDYFKKEAIEYSYEFLTQILKIPKEKLAVTCFEGNKDAPKDTFAASIWEKSGISKNRIAFLPKEDNWWGPAGTSGPCGPDTEMFYWTGKDKAPEKFDPKDKRWVEIWNDVFMQYNKTKEGKYIELTAQNVDTGMGLERTLAVLNGLSDNYRTELFWPIIEKIQELSNKKYEDNEKIMRVISDHLKAATMIMGDNKGIAPSNLDQGYVVRRLIRRSINYARKININESFCSQIAEEVIKIYKTQYPEVEKNKEFILNNLTQEEDKFSKTLEKGLREFNKIEGKTVSGKQAFILFTSHGFPVELTQELAKEKGMHVDLVEFKQEMEKHQELSRTATQGKFKSGLADHSEQTTKLHTAAHLLLSSLNKILKQEINQKGSNINPERLRLDFNFDRKITDEELAQIEELVNKKIQASLEVRREELPKEKAFASGAHGDFGAKYPDIVSVYTVIDPSEKIGYFSKEICTGPHVKNTKELIKFKIQKEESVSAGVRRIKAIVD